MLQSPLTPYRKKLIEVDLPLAAINKESAREKSIRRGHPSTLHLWWARKPLAASRAWLWARTIPCPNPACGIAMPMRTTFQLSAKKGREHWTRPVVDAAAKRISFVVQDHDGGIPKEGTVAQRGARGGRALRGGPLLAGRADARRGVGVGGRVPHGVAFFSGAEGREERNGIDGAAEVAAALDPGVLDKAECLAKMVYDVYDRRSDARAASAFNDLAAAWEDILRRAQDLRERRRLV